jgi:hypothetical protein
VGINVQGGSGIMQHLRIRPFPLQKRFAFSLVDDTDDATLEKVKRSYTFLDELGFKITKTVWAFPSKRKSGDATTGRWCEAVTLADPNYLSLIKDIKARGHEIALHTASGGNNLREETIMAYEFFKREFGSYPVMNIMHGRNIDNLYYGKEAFRGVLRFLIGIYSADACEGHSPQSPFFWGDIFAAHSRYARLYKTTTLNTLRINPSMPYYHPAKPFVPRWFSLTDLREHQMIKRNLTLSAIERLLHEEGACIGYTYTHGYFDDTLKIDPVIEERFKLLSGYKTHAWFTPASCLLDRLEAVRNTRIKNHYGQKFIFNYNVQPVRDIWICGPSGTRVNLENGKQIAIGPSGTVHCDEIPPSVDANESSRCQGLRFGEELRMILHTAYLLMLQYAMGRPFRRRGF